LLGIADRTSPRSRGGRQNVSVSLPGFTEASTTLVGLKIGGKPVTIGSEPNTVINILGLGKLTINQQITSPTGIIVRALDLEITSSGKKLPVGAHLQVAAAYAAAFKAARATP